MFGCDVDTILDAIGDDERIGHEYLRTGGTYGGPCLPRDNAALTRAYGDNVFPMFAWTDKHNHNHLMFIADQLVELGDDMTFNVVGLSYKTGVTHTIESFGAWLRELLEDHGWRYVDEQREADVIIIAQPVSDDIELRDPTVHVFDVWRARHDLKDKCEYVAFGGTPS
jgi:UDPglucose 6-dehydrogenase